MTFEDWFYQDEIRLNDPLVLSFDSSFSAFQDKIEGMVRKAYESGQSYGYEAGFNDGYMMASLKGN